MTLPVAVNADGNLKLVYLPALADPATPTATEGNGGTALALSCYLTGDGFRPNTDEQAVTDDRLCSLQTLEDRGRFMDQLEIAYVYNPASPGDDQARTTLTAGTTGFIIVRWGVAYETAFAANDIVDVYQVRFGIQRKQAADQNSKLRIVQKPFVYGKTHRDVVMAA